MVSSSSLSSQRGQLGVSGPQTVPRLVLPAHFTRPACQVAGEGLPSFAMLTCSPVSELKLLQSMSLQVL